MSTKKTSIENESDSSCLGTVSCSLQSAICEIENAMERWHLARDNDDETLQKINDILVGIEKLGWFNK